MKLWSTVAGTVLSTLVTLVVGIGNYDYEKVLGLSLLFHEAQRSGKLPPNNRIPWRGDSALEDKGQHGEDLTGGYYDAGDYIKFGFTMASTVTQLAWGVVSYSEAYKSAGQYRACLEAIKWATDYFIKCHVGPNELYAQVGEFALDHAFWGRPEDLKMQRPAYKIDAQHPGSDLAGETAAALAAAAIVFAEEDPVYAAKMLQHSKELYHFAVSYKGMFHKAIKVQYYESTGYGDELAWAAAWLFRATNQTRYLQDAEHHYIRYKLGERPNGFYYNKKDAGVQVLLAQLTGKREFVAAATAFCDYSLHQQKRTPKGLVYIDKLGTLCHASNIAFVCLQAADLDLELATSAAYRRFAKSQIDYMLGDSGRSFVVGFGENSPQQPHHAASSCPERPAPCGWDAFTRPGANPHILYGALVSGPDENDFYQDKRVEYVYNEVTLDYNGGFQSAVAGLRQMELEGLLDADKNKTNYAISQ